MSTKASWSSEEMKTVKEFVDLVKASPGKYNYASGGSGSVSHLSAALFVKRAELNMTHISYKGGAPAVTDLLGGNVQMYFGNFSELYPHVSGGNIRIIGVSSDKRAAQLPQVATIAESGFPGFKTVTWNGLMAPAGTPAAVVPPPMFSVWLRLDGAAVSTANRPFTGEERSSMSELISERIENAGNFELT